MYYLMNLKKYYPLYVRYRMLFLLSYSLALIVIFSIIPLNNDNIFLAVLIYSPALFYIDRVVLGIKNTFLLVVLGIKNTFLFIGMLIIWCMWSIYAFWWLIPVYLIVDSCSKVVIIIN